MLIQTDVVLKWIEGNIILLHIIRIVSTCLQYNQCIGPDLSGYVVFCCVETVNGTTGEGLSLSIQERKQLAEEWMCQGKDKWVAEREPGIPDLSLWYRQTWLQSHIADYFFFFLWVLLLLSFVPQLLCHRSLLFCSCQLAGIHFHSAQSLWESSLLHWRVDRQKPWKFPWQEQTAKGGAVF